MKLTFLNLVKEICKRDNAKGTGYDLRANHVSAVLRHLFEIFEQEHSTWDKETRGKMRYLDKHPVFLFIISRMKTKRKKSQLKPGRRGV